MQAPRTGRAACTVPAISAVHRCTVWKGLLLHVDVWPPPPRAHQVLEGLFIFCCVWSIGACLVQHPEAKERDRFDAFIRSIAAMGTINTDWWVLGSALLIVDEWWA